MAGQAVKVKREILEACITCPLCKKLLRDATTISMCLHTCNGKMWNNWLRKYLVDNLIHCIPVNQNLHGEQASERNYRQA